MDSKELAVSAAYLSSTSVHLPFYFRCIIGNCRLNTGLFLQLQGLGCMYRCIFRRAKLFKQIFSRNVASSNWGRNQLGAVFVSILSQCKGSWECSTAGGKNRSPQIPTPYKQRVLKMLGRSGCVCKFAGVTRLSVKDPRGVELKQKHM